MRCAQHGPSRRRSWWPPWPLLLASSPSRTTLLVWTLLLVAAAAARPADGSITCAPGIKSPGGTVPRGDIFLEYGKGAPLVITCVLDPDNEIVRWLSRGRDAAAGNRTTAVRSPSRRIAFYKNAELVPARHVTVLNSTAAQLRVSDPPPGRDMFSCMLMLDNAGDDDAAATAPTDATEQPTSLETSGPPPLARPENAMGVCLNSVAVGYKPLLITNFTCISDNWVSLTCNWTKPENPINTDYKLFFRLPGRAGGRPIIKCPTDSDRNENTCYWDFSTNPIYRQPYEYYYFTLIGENVLGNSSTPIRFHHYANVIPASPINITVVDKTQSSAMIRWSVGTLTLFPRELIHKIEYKSQWDSNPEHWHSINVTEICNSSLSSNQTASLSNPSCRERDTGYYHFNVTDLKYPFAHYDFRVYVRSSVARGEEMWSAPGCITLKTKPSIPRRPPRTDIGSFESVLSPLNKSTRDVFIYWQNIEDYEKGGDSFEYRASYSALSTDNQTIIYHSNETYKNYAKFEGLSSNVGYNFTVYSSNKEGLSAEYSAIYVPSELDKLNEPLSFTKMAFDEQGIFELSWKNASDQLSTSNRLSDYTIFWCENDKDRPYQCNGYMNWKHIPSTESCYNVSVSDHTKIYQFAISANSKTAERNDFNSLYQSIPSSSGMVWASCTVLHNKIVGKIKNVWVNMIGSTSMELRWKLDCSDRIGAVLGFRIFYCPVVSINNSACKEPMLNKTVSGEMAQDSRGIASVTHLKPYTTYMVTIALITKHGEGLHSDPLLNTTLEGAPDVQDLKIEVSNLTNTSVNLSWSPPKFTNGIVRYYYVHYYLDDALTLQQQQDLIDSSDEQLTINDQRRITSHDAKCRIDHLESYRRYKFTVTACTTLCSEESFPIHVRTSVGVPGRIAQPNVLYENSTRIIVSWPRPSKPAGPVDYYELVVAHHSGPTNSQTTNVDLTAPLALASTRIEESSNHFFYKSESNVFRVPVPDCNDKHDNKQQTFSFAVRAVNNNPNDLNRPYYGPWSTPGTVSCVLPGLPLVLLLGIWSCLFVVLTVVSTYLGNRFWKKYKIMHNVKVVLPPTLNINFKFDQFGDDFDDVLDTSQQHYYVEDGHIIYAGAPAADGVAYNANGNVSSPAAVRGRNDSCTDSDLLPQSRWSPGTATTMVAADDDGEPPSVKRHQFVLPPSIPAAIKNSGYRGGDDSAAAAAADVKPGDALEDPPRPTEPVLPFFTMPDMPPLPSMSAAVPPPLPAPRVKMMPAAVCSATTMHGAVGPFQQLQLAPVLATPAFDRGGYQLGGGNVVLIAAPRMPENRNRLCGGGVVVVAAERPPAVVPTIDCFVGDQRQSEDEDNDNNNCDGEDDDEVVDRCKLNSAEDERDDDDDGGGGESTRSPSPDEKFAADGASSASSSDEDPLEDDDGPLPPPSVFDDPPPQQRGRHDGYCGKHMMIAVAAAAAAASTANAGDAERQQQQQQHHQQLLLSLPEQLPPPPQQPQPVVAPPTIGDDDERRDDDAAAAAAAAVTSVAYVMLDMVTAQKRLLEQRQGRSDYVKPSAFVHRPPPALSAADDAVVGSRPDADTGALGVTT